MKLFIPVVLLVLIKITYSERTLEDQNIDEIEPSFNAEDDNDIREPNKRTIGLKNPGFARHVGINSLGHKHVYGYGPVDYKYVPVIKPIVLKPVTHSHVFKPLIKPVRIKPVSHYLPIKPVRRPVVNNGWKPVIAPNVPLPPKHPGKPWQNEWDNKRPSISLLPPVAGSGQHGVQVNPDVDVRPAVPEVPVIPLEPTPQLPIQPVHPLVPDHPVISHPHPVYPQPVFPQPIFPEPVYPHPLHPQPVFPQPLHPQPVFPQHLHPQPLHPQPVFPQPVYPHPIFPHHPEQVPPVFQFSPPHVGKPDLPVLPLGAAFNPELLHTKAVIPQNPLPVHPFLPPHAIPHHGIHTPALPSPVLPFPPINPISVVPPPALGPASSPAFAPAHPGIIPGSNFVPGTTVFHGHPGIASVQPEIFPASPVAPIHPTVVHPQINPGHPAFVPAQPGIISPPINGLPPTNHPHGITPPSIFVDQPPFIHGHPPSFVPGVNNVIPTTHLHPVPNRPFETPSHPFGVPNNPVGVPSHPVGVPNHPLDEPNHHFGVPNHPIGVPNYPDSLPNYPEQPNHPVHPIHALQPQPSWPDHNPTQHSGGAPEPYPLPKPSGVEFHGKAAHLIPLSNPSFNVVQNTHNNPSEGGHDIINPGVQSPQEPINYHAKHNIPQGHFIPGIHHIPQNDFNPDIHQSHNNLLPSSIDSNDNLSGSHHQFTPQQEQHPGISIQPGQTDIQLPFHLPSHPTFSQNDANVNIFQQNNLNDAASHDVVGPTDATFSGYVK